MRMLEGIELAEIAKRREAVLKSLKGSVGLVFAGDHAPPLRGDWDPNFHFLYLTGILDEVGAMVYFDLTAPDPDKRIVLLLRPTNPEHDIWDGLREPLGQALREKTGFKTVMRTTMLPRMLTEAARRSRKLALLHPIANHNAPIGPDFELFQKIAARVPGCGIEDRADLIVGMRQVKSPAEIRQIEAAIKATKSGIERLWKSLKPGVSERTLHQELIRGFEEAGSKRVAFDPIVGSGANGVVLHYKQNDQIAQDGDLMVLDCGASINGYAADITRSFPVNGKFTDDQREVFNAVLKAQEAAIKAVKPGALISDADKAARRVLEKAGFGDYMPHGIGHHLGLETHDPGLAHEELKPGMVVTIEPGVYLPHKGIGVRIEDDILVTKDGNKNLSASVPKSAVEMERVRKK
jgi:Xaa-Pro aminopeptidase